MYCEAAVKLIRLRNMEEQDCAFRQTEYYELLLLMCILQCTTFYVEGLLMHAKIQYLGVKRQNDIFGACMNNFH